MEVVGDAKSFPLIHYGLVVANSCFLAWYLYVELGGDAKSFPLIHCGLVVCELVFPCMALVCGSGWRS